VETTYIGARLALGTAVLALPSLARDVWRRMEGPGDIRLLAVRDLALVSAVLAGRGRPGTHRAALAACAASDAVDSVLCTRAARRSGHPLAWAAAASGIAGAATGVVLLRSRSRALVLDAASPSARCGSSGS
jgi:hypothetical protein